MFAKVLPNGNASNGPRMYAEQLQLSFHLAGCRSLKEKRRRLSRMKDKFGRNANLALCESDFQDTHTRAQWSFVAISDSSVVTRQILDEIIRWTDEFLDATVVEIHREAIA